MTKNERILRLERLVSELSKRVYDLERAEKFPYWPRHTYLPYTYYGTMGSVSSLGSTSGPSSAGSFSQATHDPTTEVKLGNGS